MTALKALIRGMDRQGQALERQGQALDARAAPLKPDRQPSELKDYSPFLRPPQFLDLCGPSCRFSPSVEPGGST